MRAYRRLALLFAVLLVGIILAANLGLGMDFFLWFYSIPYADKAGHFFLMGILSLLISLGFTNTRVHFLRMLKTSLILCAVVTLEELSQIFIANRTSSLADLSANYAGIILFGEIGAALQKTIKER